MGYVVIFTLKQVGISSNIKIKKYITVCLRLRPGRLNIRQLLSGLIEIDYFGVPEKSHVFLNMTGHHIALIK